MVGMRLLVLVTSIVSICLADTAGPVLQAVRRWSFVERRDINWSPRMYDPELYYVDENTIETGSQFSARVIMKPKLPVLELEDLDGHFSHVRCAHNSVEIWFSSTSQLNVAQNTWSQEENFVLITSHEGCQTEGARFPYKISSVTYHHEERMAKLVAEPVPWKEAAHGLKIDFGTEVHDKFSHSSLRRRYAIRKRQQPESPGTTLTESGTTTFASVTESPATKTSISYSMPTVKPTETAVSADISSNLTGVDILPPANSIRAHIPAINSFPEGVYLSCKKCTTSGRLYLSQGGFDISLSGVKSGFINLTASNVAGHIELGFALLAGLKLVDHPIHLPQIGIPGFSIPDIGAIGPYLDPQIIFGADLNSALNFSYGFNYSIPSGSNVILDLGGGNLSNSSTSGFKDTKIGALPFSSEIAAPSFNFSLGFRAEVLFGVTLFEDIVNIGVGTFLDLPKLTVTVSEVDNVNTMCENVSKNAVDHKLLHIVPQVELGLGVNADFEVGGVDAATEYGLLSTVFPLPTKCLDFRSKEKMYVAATATTGSKPSAGSAVMDESLRRLGVLALVVVWSLFVGFALF